MDPNLGSLWDGLGRLLGCFGRLLVVLGPSKSNFLEALVQDGLHEASGIDLGSVLEGFGEGFGKVLGRFGQGLSNLGSMFHRCKGAGGVSAKRSQSARPLGEGVLDLAGRPVRPVDVV